MPSPSQAAYVPKQGNATPTDCPNNRVSSQCAADFLTLARYNDTLFSLRKADKGYVMGKVAREYGISKSCAYNIFRQYKAKMRNRYRIANESVFRLLCRTFQFTVYRAHTRPLVRVFVALQGLEKLKVFWRYSANIPTLRPQGRTNTQITGTAPGKRNSAANDLLNSLIDLRSEMPYRDTRGYLAAFPDITMQPFYASTDPLTPHQRPLRNGFEPVPTAPRQKLPDYYITTDMWKLGLKLPTVCEESWLTNFSHYILPDDFEK